jgi:bacterial/archaeal transporter family-2 protein
MIGAIFSILAGLFIALQGVFNTRLNEKIGLLETVTLVHAIGLTTALILLIFFSNGGDFKKLHDVNKFYLLGGAFGVIIIISVIKGISLLGASFAISLMLVTQLIMATIIDLLGLFGTKQVKFDITKPLGIILMILGIVVFKIRG